jgi:hypothetical protein
LILLNTPYSTPFRVLLSSLAERYTRAEVRFSPRLHKQDNFYISVYNADEIKIGGKKRRKGLKSAYIPGQLL